MTGPFEDAEERSLIDPRECNHDEDTTCRKCDPRGGDDGPEPFDVAGDR